MERPIRILIVEDEFVTSNDLRINLEEMGYEVSGIARDAKEACAIMDQKETDFAILDITIQGDKDGIWVANQINEKYKIPFIFLTSFGDERTVKTAIQTKPYGYLVKPFERVDIFSSIEVALKNFSQIHQAAPKISGGSASEVLTIDDFLFVREKHLFSKVNLQDILYISTELKHVQIHTRSKVYLMRYNFNDFAQTLPQDHFIQTHRSYYVNKTAIEHVGNNFVMVNGIEIPLSSSKKGDFLDRFTFF